MFSPVFSVRTFFYCAAIAMLLEVLPGMREAAAQQQRPGLTISAGLELSQTYQPDAWQPVHLQLRNDTDREVGGTAVLPLADAKAPAVMTLPVSVPAHSLVTATIWGYFPPQAKLTPQQQKQQTQRTETPPLSMAEWRGADGSLLSRAEVPGIPFAAPSGQEGQPAEVVLLVDQRLGAAGDNYDAQLLLDHLNESAGPPLQLVSVPLEGLARQGAGLRSIKAVVLDAVDPQSLDLAQRDALLEYVRGGGIIVLSSPSIDATSRAGTWLEPLLPVRLVGTREADHIAAAPGGAVLKLRQPVAIVEAVEGVGQALLRDRDYVHVAVQPVGLGKVVFTSFPINALETSQPQAAVLWEQLLSLREPRWEWNRSQLGDARHAVVGGMIGRKVAPWAVAAGVAAGYLLVIVAAQGIFFGAARPRAFVMSIAAAIVASALLLGMGMARRSDQSLQSARLAVIDVASGGNGWQQETVAFVGTDDPQMRLAAADERVSIRPSLADARNRPMIRQQPFIVEKSEVYGDRIERAWEAAGPADPMWRISAIADLGAGGLTLDVDNGLGSVLESPLVIWNGRALAIADLPTGRTTVRDVQVNPRQQFTGLGVLTSDQAKRRAQVVAASLAPPSETTVGTSANVPPMLIGWVADAGASLVRPVDHDAIEQKSMAMVRTPLRFHVPPPGSAVTVPAALVRVVPGRMPYDVTKDESVPSQQDGQWLVGFELPRAVGHVRPKRATLELRVNVPGHQLVVRQNQCTDGAAQTDALQEPIGAWDRAVASPRVNIDLGPRDVDRDGRVWLLFDVHSVGAVSGNNPLSWQIEDLGLSVEAEAVAPPDPIAFEPTTTTKPTEGEGIK